MAESEILTPSEALDEFRAAGALLEGHFILSSGLHSPVFLQKDVRLSGPTRTEVCAAPWPSRRARRSGKWMSSARPLWGHRAGL